MEQALTQFAVKILCDDSTGFDEVGDFFLPHKLTQTQC